MIAEQRQEQILELAGQQEFVEVEDLAARFGVSAMTIRRDLMKLDREGRMVRQHGGARIAEAKEEKPASEHLRPEYEYASKKSQNRKLKQQLAGLALREIREGDTIYLDAGTTTFELARLLRGRQDLTVITNDLIIAMDLTAHDVQTSLLGGKVQKETMSVVGPKAREELLEFRVATAFIATTSVSSAFDVLSPSSNKALLKRAAMDIAERSFLVTDHTKFHTNALHRFATLADFTGVITDADFTEEEQQHLASLGAVIISN